MAAHNPRRRTLLIGSVVVLLVACGLAALLISVIGPSGRQRLVRESLELRTKLERTALVHLRPLRKFPHVSLFERRRHTKEPPNEPPRPPTRAAAAGARFIRSASLASTAAVPLPASPRSNDLTRFELARFTNTFADFTAEPSVAASDGRILETWNWGAALSSDDGRTFTFIDPSDPNNFSQTGGGFCCDQLAYYVPRWDLWVWLMQYSPDKQTGKDSILRLAVARGKSAFDAARANASSFWTYDLSPTSFGYPVSAWFDFDGIASTSENLFVATNVAASSAYTGVVIRIPLAELAADNVRISDVRFFSTAPLAVPRLAQGATSTMFFAAHRNASTLRIWRWADASTQVFRTDVAHDAYGNRRPYHCRRTPGPRTDDWCEGLRDGGYKNDDSVLAGWLANGRVGFAWDAREDPADGFPFPFVMAVQVDATTMKLVDEPIIWNPRYAYQYPSFAPNARGDLGGIVFRGGGRLRESCTAVVRDPFSTRSASGWQAYTLDTSNADPAQPHAGDYLGVAPSSANANTWVGGCMSLRGGGTASHLAIDYFAFGRANEPAP
jgi:hypothetical protein